MTRRGVVVLVLAALLVAPVGNAVAQSDADAGVGAEAERAAVCAGRLRAASEVDEAPEELRLADVCADFADEIESGAWGDALGSTSAEELSARPFEELAELMAHYQQAPSETGLAVEELAAVVESLRPFEPVAELSLWERIRDWIREALGLDEATGAGGIIAWLRNLSIPAEWVRTIFYVLGITVVIAALIVAVNELRVGGLLGGGDAGPRDSGRLRPAPAWATRVPLTLEGVRRAPTANQPALLLAMLVERLRTRFGDGIRDSLTHRELSAAAGPLGLRRRNELDAVVSAAERVTFAGWRPDPADVEPVFSQGKAVLEELESEREPAAPRLR